MITTDRHKWDILNRHELTFINRSDVMDKIRKMGYRPFYSDGISDGVVVMLHHGYIMPRTERTSNEIWFGRDYERLLAAAKSLTDDDGGLRFEDYAS